MENHHPSTHLSMDPVGVPATSSFPPHDECERGLLIRQQTVPSAPPDINLPLSDWHLDMLNVALGRHIHDPESILTLPKSGARKGTKRNDNIWGAWFFFNFYFKPVLHEKSKVKISWDSGGVTGFGKSDLKTDVFLVQHDMENMYMWVFKDRPENALGKMQLRSYMNGHSRPGEPQFPFSVDKGFVRSHRMQRKHYRGLSNPQCIHGIEYVRLPNMAVVPEPDRKKWVELTRRDLNFAIPPEASDFGSWRNLPCTDFEIERPLSIPLLKTSTAQRKLFNGSGLNLLTRPLNHSGVDGMDHSPLRNKRKKDLYPRAMDEDFCDPINPYFDRARDMDVHPVEPAWLNEFSGVMRHTYGPVTAAKTIYEDEEGYLIMVTLSFSDQRRVKVSWRNNLTHGIVKILCVSTARMPYIKKHDRTFKLTDPSPEHCPPGEFIREIPLPTRIPEDARLEAYYNETGSVLEIMVPKHRVGPEEHEVRVCIRSPHLNGNELLLS